MAENEDLYLPTDRARAGSTPGVVRWMLAIGLTVVIAGMALIWLVGHGNS